MPVDDDDDNNSMINNPPLQENPTISDTHKLAEDILDVRIVRDQLLSDLCIAVVVAIVKLLLLLLITLYIELGKFPQHCR